MSHDLFGPHGGFILAAYGISALIVLGLILRALLDGRAQRRALAAIEGEDFARRTLGSRVDE